MPSMPRLLKRADSRSDYGTETDGSRKERTICKWERNEEWL